MSGHTKGPWVARRGSGWLVCRPEAMERREAAIMVGTSPAVSLISAPGEPYLNQWFDDSEAEANARLIAAAPEMLEALKGVLKHLDEKYDEDYSYVVEDAKSAIAKAEGK